MPVFDFSSASEEKRSVCMYIYRIYIRQFRKNTGQSDPGVGQPAKTVEPSFHRSILQPEPVDSI